MILWTSGDAVEATWGVSVAPWQASGVSIDTRTLVPGDLFIALTVARDGHDFVAEALEKGAAAAMVSRIPDGLDQTAPLLVVDDVQRGLEALGRYARARLSGRVLAITGSVGKTTTKEMARIVFAGQMRVHAAEASYNNHWGVPLTLARTPPGTELAVIEIGMSHPGEIAPLTRMARPHVAMVTSVAPAHLEAFSGLDAIAREKASIFEGLESGGTAILNADLDTTPILAAAAGPRALTFGETEGADLQILDVRVQQDTTVVRCRHAGHELIFRIGGPGRHLAMNAAAVVAAAEPLGADPDLAAQAMLGWHPPRGRGTRETVLLDEVEGRAIELIDDAFNANPASVGAALERLAAARPDAGGRRVAILGDMLELGPDEEAIHAALAGHAAMEKIGCIHTAGPRMRALHDALPDDRRGRWFETAEALGAVVGQMLHSGDIVLVKGSKSARTALVVDAIRKLGHRHRRPAPEDT